MDTQKRCASCGQEIPLDAKKCSHCRSRQPGQSALIRPREGKLIAGVCAGIARELGVDPTLVRVGFAVVAVISIGLAFWGYILLWAITPTARFEDPPLTRGLERIRRWFAPAPRGLPVPEDGPGAQVR
jgi:phage shock protein C